MSVQLKQVTVATSQTVDRILNCLKEQVGNCLYMYIDIKKYGIEHPDMKVWFQEDSNESMGISLVVMKYYNSISFYTCGTNWSQEDVLSLLEYYAPDSVSAPLASMEAIAAQAKDYHLSTGWVFEYKQFKEFPVDYIEKATKEDLWDVAELLCSDEGFGAIYSVETLHKQLVERLETNMGRNLIIRSQENKIVAQIATYAECDGIAVTSGMIVHPDHRDSMYGSILESNIVKELQGESFRVFTFVIEKKRKRLLDALKQDCIGQYGRLTRVSE